MAGTSIRRRRANKRAVILAVIVLLVIAVIFAVQAVRLRRENEILKKYKDLLEFLIPHYKEEGKHRLVIAIGCTGGVHRSVAITENLGAFLREKGYPTEINHRDMLLEQARWTNPIEDGES